MEISSCKAYLDKGRQIHPEGVIWDDFQTNCTLVELVIQNTTKQIQYHNDKKPSKEKSC